MQKFLTFEKTFFSYKIHNFLYSDWKLFSLASNDFNVDFHGSSFDSMNCWQIFCYLKLIEITEQITNDLWKNTGNCPVASSLEKSPSLKEYLILTPWLYDINLTDILIPLQDYLFYTGASVKWDNGS